MTPPSLPPPTPPAPSADGPRPDSATGATDPVALALRDLHQALATPPGASGPVGNWRWTVRQRMAGVRDVLIREYDVPRDEGLSARRASMVRERTALLMRMSELGGRVLEDPDLAGVRSEMVRLLGDVQHHFQRLRDLAYDDVELELGGSE